MTSFMLRAEKNHVVEEREHKKQDRASAESI
jgi:hypothetical protein